MYVRTGLIAEQQPALLGAAVDAGDGRSAFAVAAVVRERERTAERTRHRLGVLPEQREQQRVPRYQAAQGRQRVASVAKSCEQKITALLN